MSLGLNQIISIIETDQDVGLATMIASLRNNPGQLQTFLQNQQTKVYNDIARQKDDTFQKVYGDLQQSQQVQDSVLRYNNRTKQLTSLQNNMIENQTQEASATVDNKNNFRRKTEMNEWTVGNKRDTLFVFSSLFVVLSVLVCFTALHRMNVIGSSMWAITCVVTILIFVLIVLNRSQYTDNSRNKRYWNKKKFGGKYGTIPIPSICPEPVARTNVTK